MNHLEIIANALNQAGKNGAFTGREAQYYLNVFDAHAQEVETLSKSSLEQQKRIKELETQITNTKTQ
ncbi:MULTISPECIES: hypothetical protein [Leeuwenhoekiella]|jgi:phage shock protein A|uniref:hypothetical protein n=1 Tax=Leeuwenhoekiella TaxID=283735 RepID=UPI000C094878|nr:MULTISPECIES: hypothetical protein [Leeuwenhoekiella]MAD90511.1 hypothetical protein [Pseudoalteromonas sp.]MAO42167.1 hypothetical protein [Leeuwenhoekiella sp.]|tara:strand:+ start:467 stop:667 length:201 start_codon:yes stop_codon:yes gene_type:complete